MLVLGADADDGVHRAVGEQDAAALVQQHQRVGQMRQHVARQRREEAGAGIGGDRGPFLAQQAAAAREDRDQYRRRGKAGRGDP